MSKMLSSWPNGDDVLGGKQAINKETDQKEKQDEMGMRVSHPLLPWQEHSSAGPGGDGPHRLGLGMKIRWPRPGF